MASTRLAPNALPCARAWPHPKLGTVGRLHSVRASPSLGSDLSQRLASSRASASDTNATLSKPMSRRTPMTTVGASSSASHQAPPAGTGHLRRRSTRGRSAPALPARSAPCGWCQGGELRFLIRSHAVCGMTREVNGTHWPRRALLSDYRQVLYWNCSDVDRFVSGGTLAVTHPGRRCSERR